MEGLGYVDIFSTKGMEYLLVVGYLLILVAFWKFLTRPSAKTLAAAVPAGRGAGVERRWFQLADGFFFHQGHTWAAPEEGDVVKVGVDDFAQKMLGQPGSVELPEIGSLVRQGEKGWRFRIDSKSIDMLSPVNGEVLAINEEIFKLPELICNEPYGNGWLMKIKVSKLKTDLKNLISGKLATAWLEETVDRLRPRLAGDVGAVLQDGGIPLTGFAKSISPTKWDEIAREFLLVD